MTELLRFTLFILVHARIKIVVVVVVRYYSPVLLQKRFYTLDIC